MEAKINPNGPSRPSRWEGHLRTALACQTTLLLSLISLYSMGFRAAFLAVVLFPPGRGFSTATRFQKRLWEMGRTGQVFHFPFPINTMRSVCSMILKSSRSEMFSMYTKSSLLRVIICSTFSA